MRIDQIMTSPVYTCHPEEHLDAAARIMWERDTGFVPVVDEADRPVGVITDRDICMAAYTRGIPVASIRVWEAMSQKLHSVKETESVGTAESIMRKHRVRRLPVVGHDGAVVGVLSLNDIALVTSSPRLDDGMQARILVDTIAAISQHREEVSQSMHS